MLHSLPNKFLKKYDEVVKYKVNTHSPPWRGEFSEQYTLMNWGGLLNSEPNDEVSDTTGDDSSAKADKQNIKNLNLAI